jgi:hypothetical protein
MTTKSNGGPGKTRDLNDIRSAARIWGRAS